MGIGLGAPLTAAMPGTGLVALIVYLALGGLVLLLGIVAFTEQRVSSGGGLLAVLRWLIGLVIVLGFLILATGSLSVE